MITNEQIEAQDYSINDVADLKYRLEIAVEALNGIIGAIEHDQSYKAREWAINDLSRIEGEHMPFCDGKISLHKDKYGCMCALIVSGEDGVEREKGE